MGNDFGLTDIQKWGEILEHAYDSQGILRGYVDGNVIYDRHMSVLGYTDGTMLYDRYSNPLGYVDGGSVYTMDGSPVAYYDDDNRVYDMDGNYMGFGNQGFRGTLGFILLLLLLRRLFRRRRRFGF